VENINIMNDALFKALFRNKAGKKVLIKVLSILLGIDERKLKKAYFQSGELPKKKLSEKGKVCDLIIELKDDNIIIVEMNNTNEKNIHKKNATYAYSIITERVKQGKQEKEEETYPKVILINIDNFNKFKTKKGILSFMSRSEEGIIETEDGMYQSIHLLLDNLIKGEYNEYIKKFARFLKGTSIDKLKEEFKGDDEYMACIRKVEDLSTDPKFIGYYDLEEAHQQALDDNYNFGFGEGYNKGQTKGFNSGRTAGLTEGFNSGRNVGLTEGFNQGIEQGFNQGIEQGFNQGIEQGFNQGISQGIASEKINTARNLLSLNISIDDISKATGLTIEEINKLKPKTKVKVKV